MSHACARRVPGVPYHLASHELACLIPVPTFSMYFNGRSLLPTFLTEHDHSSCALHRMAELPNVSMNEEDASTRNATSHSIAMSCDDLGRALPQRVSLTIGSIVPPSPMELKMSNRTRAMTGGGACQPHR